MGDVVEEAVAQATDLFQGGSGDAAPWRLAPVPLPVREKTGQLLVGEHQAEAAEGLNPHRRTTDVIPTQYRRPVRWVLRSLAAGTKKGASDGAPFISSL
ncbi:hypothetical protein [Pseudooceanicola atlanticus]|uniref:Uncharacterized protein n=1 Tax=Pseudooceanicola atlanticus TaxID=1461694 RepID=A0A0A0EE44_9RHOB|nr:hypothetical protein [Pseudooceanicola atlanticus]KGM48585.1 hypothetical protein ATO9_13230 [Pseudooceanicola atlanticus]